jgi:hypothetical protein
LERCHDAEEAKYEKIERIITYPLNITG